MHRFGWKCHQTYCGQTQPKWSEIFCESGWTDREISLELYLILIASKMCLALENGVDDDDDGVGDDDDQEDVGEYQQFEARLV